MSCDGLLEGALDKDEGVVKAQLTLAVRKRRLCGQRG
jgi:hypothetical protein